MMGGGKGCRGKEEQGEGEKGAGGRGQLVSRHAPSAADVPLFWGPSLSPSPSPNLSLSLSLSLSVTLSGVRPRFSR